MFYIRCLILGIEGCGCLFIIFFSNWGLIQGRERVRALNRGFMILVVLIFFHKT